MAGGRIEGAMGKEYIQRSSMVGRGSTNGDDPVAANVKNHITGGP